MQHMNAGFDWYNPVQVSFGSGVLNALPESSTMVVIADENSMNSAIGASLKQSLTQQCQLWIDVKAQLLTTSDAHDWAIHIWPQLEKLQLQAGEPSTILAIGGGTTLDLAKLLRYRFDSSESIADAISYWRASQLPNHVVRHPLWLAPTTAGTGSEVSASATVWDVADPQNAHKFSWAPENGHADRAFIEPALSLSCPYELSRDCALDALAHALEAIWNHEASAATNALALNAAQKILDTLPLLLHDMQSLSLRTQLAEASWQAGLAMSQTKTALAHALSYELTLHEGLAHGHACAVWLVMCWRLAQGCSIDCDAALSSLRVIDHDTQLNRSMNADDLQRWLSDLGIESRDARFDPEGCDQLFRAMTSSRGRNFIGIHREAE
jgi:alcohol dehydrogenase